MKVYVMTVEDTLEVLGVYDHLPEPCEYHSAHEVWWPEEGITAWYFYEEFELQEKKDD